MKITKLVQSTILIEDGEHAVLVDPGSYNTSRGIGSDRFSRLDALVITHRHSDHFDLDLTRSLTARFGSTVYTNPEIALKLGAEGIGSKILRPGDAFECGELRFLATFADHRVRCEVIPNFGLVVAHGDRRLYHTSDTAMIESGVLNEPAAVGVDLMFVPISNRGVVMGIDDALHMVADFEPRIAVPMHYDSPKDAPRVNARQFVDRAAELREVLDGLNRVEVRVLDFEDSIELAPDERPQAANAVS